MARGGEKRVPLTVSVSPALKSELEAEAWECEQDLSAYVRGLLTRRGKWARSVGTAGGYDIGDTTPKAPK